MNVLVCSHAWTTETSGLGNVIKTLCDYLRERGHTVIILVPGATEVMRETRKWGCEAYEINLRYPAIEGHAVKSRVSFALFLPAVLYQMMRLLRTRSIHIVNTHFADDCFVYAAMCRKLLGGRLGLITSVHGADLFPDGLRRPRYSYAIRSLLKGSDAIVAASRSFLNDTLQVFPDLERKLVCIQNGIRYEEFRDGEASVVAGDRYVLCVAMHNQKKGLDTLIRAFKKVSEAHDRLTLRLVGDGPLRPMLEELTGAAGLSGRIEFLGIRSRPEIVRLMKGAELFVLPSRAEPFGIALLEAAACRRPIVASRVGGVPEIIQNEVNGLLVPPDDADALSAALLRLLDCPKLRKTLGDSAYETVSKRFRWEMMGAQYESLMSRLLASRREGVRGPAP
jgi:glycosyltransferase involved in cell wall biosynthesis